MKRIFLLCLTLGMMTSLYAEWKTSDTDATVISETGQYGQVQLLSARNANGSTALTWLRTSDLSYDDPNFGYYLYIQIFDSEGNEVFPQGGHLVSAQPTLSWVSSYSLTYAENGDFLIAYADNRAKKDNSTQVYAYRFTEKGESVWDAAGVSIPSVSKKEKFSDMSPKILTSGENVYVGFAHSETNNENYQIYQLNPTDGSLLWEQPVTISSPSLFLYPAPEGDIYTLFDDSQCILYAQRLTPSATYAWRRKVQLSQSPLSYHGFITDISAVATDDGGLSLGLTIPTNFYAYNSLNHLSPNGRAYAEILCMSGDPDVGDSSYPVLGTRGDLTMAIWPYSLSSAEHHMMCNLFNHSQLGSYAWKDEKAYGISFGVNDMWGMKALKTIPQTDGWVLFYADLQSWSGANMHIVKVNDSGVIIWRKQICEPDFECAGYTIETDGERIYFYYSIEQEYDDDWNPIPGDGGMYMMAIDITNEGNGVSGIREIPISNVSESYDIMGRKITPNYHGIVIENGRKILR